MTGREYAVMMYADGLADGIAHLPPKFEDEPEYATGYAVGEAQR